MSIDEVIRAIGYAVLAPGLGYLGMVAHNRKQYWWCWLAWLLSLFFWLLLIGLALLRYSTPIPGLLYLNTVIVVAMALVVLRASLHNLRLWWVEWRMQREHERLQRFSLLE